MESKEPVFKKIADEIQQNIVKEGYGLNHKLPSENELVDKYNVSRTTIQRSLRYLENQGIIRREQGKGSFVNIQKARIAIFNFSGFSDHIKKMGKEVTNKIVNQEIIEKDGKPVLKIERLRGMKDGCGVTWLTLDHSLLNLSLFPGLEDYDFEKCSLYEVLREEYAIYPQYSHLKAQAIISTETYKDYFSLEEETALVKIIGTVLDTDQNVIEEVSIIYNPVTDFNFLVSV